MKVQWLSDFKIFSVGRGIHTERAAALTLHKPTQTHIRSIIEFRTEVSFIQIGNIAVTWNRVPKEIKHIIEDTEYTDEIIDDILSLSKKGGVEDITKVLKVKNIEEYV